jgi:hypothetical protein
MSFTLWLSACGEDEVSLSDLIVGSWRCIDEELSGTMVYPAGDELVMGRMDARLTFYKTGNFAHVFTMSYSIDSEASGEIKAITEGTYEVFDKTIVFRAQDSEVQTFWWPPLFGDIMEILMEDMLDSLLEIFESMFTETYGVEIRRNILTLRSESDSSDDSSWQRI